MSQQEQQPPAEEPRYSLNARSRTAETTSEIASGECNTDTVRQLLRRLDDADRRFDDMSADISALKLSTAALSEGVAALTASRPSSPNSLPSLASTVLLTPSESCLSQDVSAGIPASAPVERVSSPRPSMAEQNILDRQNDRMLFNKCCDEGYQPGQISGITESFVSRIFPPLELNTPDMSNFSTAQLSPDPDRVKGMPHFFDTSDPHLHKKLSDAQNALRRKAVPIRYWAWHTAPYLTNEYDLFRHAINVNTPWHQLVLAIICKKGLNLYYLERESALWPSTRSQNILFEWQKLVDAFTYAVTLFTDGYVRANQLAIAVAQWDRNMSSLLMHELTRAVPTADITQSTTYLSVLSSLHAFAHRRWSVAQSSAAAARNVQPSWW